MKGKYLQTVVSGCAWCKKLIDASSHEVELQGEEEFTLLSHGICKECNDKFEMPSEEDEAEENLILA